MKNKLIFFIFAVLCTVFLITCSSDAEVTSTTGLISGSVVDKTTGEPIAVANVKLQPSGRSTVTGSDGAFEFRDMDAGKYSVSVTKEGYNSGEATVTVTADNTTECHILLQRIPSVVTADRELLDFGSNYSTNTLSFNIVNNFYESLEWEIVNNCVWITSVSPESGELTHSKTATIVVKIDRDLLEDGENVAILVLRTAGQGSVEVTVKATGQAQKTATLNTLDVTNIAATKATFNGQIVTPGYPEYTERGFVFSEQTMPTIEQTISRLTSAVTADDKFSYDVVGLTLGKTYYVRAYAVNPVGIAYSSNQVVFTTQTVTGKVEMTSIDDIDLANHTAVVHAKVTDLGDPAYTERGFVYSNTNSTPTIYNSYVVVNGSGLGTFDTKLTELARETNYYVRAYIKNEAGIAYSDSDNVLILSTEESRPTVETLDATDIDSETYSAVLHGNIKAVGNPPYTERGFVYSTEYEKPTIDDTKVVISGAGNGNFSARVSGFSKEKKTYIRAYAKNSKGVAYGETIEIFEPEFIILESAGIAVQKEDIDDNTHTWINAMTLCENSHVGSFYDWRLPKINELAILYSYKDYIGGFIKAKYWASNQTSDYNGAGAFDMAVGDYSSYTKTSKFRVRCVRTLTE